MPKEGGYASEEQNAAIWRGEGGVLPPVTPVGVEVVPAEYHLANWKDPNEMVDQAPVDKGIVAEGTFDISRHDKPPVVVSVEEEPQHLGVVLDFAQLEAKKEAVDVSARIREALLRFENATTPEAKRAAFDEIKQARSSKQAEESGPLTEHDEEERLAA